MASLDDVRRSVKTALRPWWRSGKTALGRVAGQFRAARFAPAKTTQKGAGAGKVRFIPYGSSGISIAVVAPQVSDLVQDRLRTGRYEVAESQMCVKLLGSDEVVVELGAGLGLISTVVMKSGKAREIHCFEADQRLLGLIKATHEKNGVTNAFLYNAAVTSDAAALLQGEMTFHLRQNFWGNSTNPNAGKRARFAVQVKTKSLPSILQSIRPTILIADIEGAEMGLFADADLTGVQRILLEVHPRAIGGAGVRSVFDDLHKAGFCYDPQFSSGAVPGFSRV